MDEVWKMLKTSDEKMPEKFEHNVTKAMDEVKYQSPLTDKFTKHLEPAMYGTKVLTKTDKAYGNLAARMEWKALKDKGLSDMELKELISNESKLRTFTRDPSSLSKVLLYAKTKLPGFRWVMPFIRTSTDIIGQAVEHTPAGIVNLVRKSSSQRDAAQRAARIIKGTLLGLWAHDKWKKGQITGDAPKDTKGRNHFLQVQKKAENAILINGNWVPLSNFEPIGSILSAFVNYYQGVKNGREDDQGKLESYASGVAAAGVALMNKRYLSGVVNLINTLSDPQKNAPKQIGQIASGFISGGVKAVTDQMDIVQRKAGNIGDQFKKRTPGVSKSVPASLDVLGRTQTKPSTANLLNMKSAALTPEDRLIYDTPMNMPPQKINGEKLSPEEYLLLSKDAGELKTKLIRKSAGTLQKLHGDRKQYLVDRISDTANQMAKMRFIKNRPKYAPKFPFLD
jgi:hypothetical protein